MADAAPRSPVPADPDLAPPADRPLLMIPGPVELSPEVRCAAAVAPPSHTAPDFIDTFAVCLDRMRQVWRAGDDAQPFLLAGGGTAAMDMAVSNLTEPGDRALVVNTGYFSDRIADMLRRAGATVEQVRSPVGSAPPPEAVGEALEALRSEGPVKLLAATHVDTSTGVAIDPKPYARLAREHDVLSVFDGVCATGGEPFDMAGWGADVYLTASQKAIGLPPGLALLVASERALTTRDFRRGPLPPAYFDWHSWLPIHTAYAERRPSYFSTPATSLVMALAKGLGEILEHGVEARWQVHRRAAHALRAAWRQLGLELVPETGEAFGPAHTLSALWLPKGLTGRLVPAIGRHGVSVAGGLHPKIERRYFRVGHMGWTATRPQLLARTAEAVARGLADCGAQVADAEAVGATVTAAWEGWGSGEDTDSGGTG